MNEEEPKTPKEAARPSPGKILGMICLPPAICGVIQLVGFSLARLNHTGTDPFWIAGAILGAITALFVGGWLATICRTGAGAVFAFLGYFICCIVVIAAISFAGCAANMKGF
jgi:hypothetical protein